MPRTCLACSNPNRAAIDAAIVTGESLRNIAKRVSISPAGLLRHKAHASVALAKLAAKREESIGDSIIGRLEKLYRRAEKVLDEAEANSDGRLALAGIREIRETLAGIYALASKTTEASPTRNTIEVQAIHIGQAPTHEWEELPASYASLLPGKLKGKLYIVREHVPA